MPHPIDVCLFDGQPVPPALLARELARPLPEVGDSYWGDAMRELLVLVASGGLAPSDLGTQAVSLARSIIDDQRSRYEVASPP